MLTAERARELLDYDPETGVFTWRVSSSNRACAGTVAGYTRPNGYIVIKVDGRRYRASRLAWLYVYGAAPVGDLDHINTSPSDNRITNLRDVSHAENHQNRRRARKGSSTGLLGVRRDKKRFSARIRADGKDLHLGMFDTPEQAHAAYVEAKRRLHPFSTL